MTAASEVERLVGAVYHRLMVLYPGAYRRAFGPLQEQVFLDLLHDTLGFGARVRLLLATAADLARSAFAEQRSALKERDMAVIIRGAFTRWSAIGLALLAPFSLLLALTILSQLMYGDDRFNAAFVQSPLHALPVLVTLVFIFPALAAVLNLFPLVRSGASGAAALRNGSAVLSGAIVLAGFGFIAFMVLHDFLPCLAHALLQQGPGALTSSLGVCWAA